MSMRRGLRAQRIQDRGQQSLMQLSPSLEGLHADDGVYWFVVRRIWHRFVTGVAAQRKFRKPKEFNGGERGIRTRWKAE
jgi:hypothetical protein